MVHRYSLLVGVALLVACGKPDPGEKTCSDDDDCPNKYSCEVGLCFPAPFDGNYCDFIECDPNGTCHEGRPPACGCNEGFDGDGVTCEDEDECADGTDDCTGEHITCENTEGSYECVCEDGYALDGSTCENIDECAQGTDNCDANATCADTDGSFDCTCIDGYEGDGVTCDDIDECDDNPCDANATCENTDGSFDCSCDDGYFGDGFQCEESIGQIIWMGHDGYALNSAVTKVFGNAIAQATTIGDIQVAGYTEFSDLSTGGEVENTDTAITGRLAQLGRTATLSHFDDYTALDLAGVDVLLVYEMENGGDPAAIGNAWASDVASFLDEGGVVVVQDHYSLGYQILDAMGLMQFAGMSGGYADVTVTVVDADDPVVADVGTTYIGTDGTASHVTNDGRIIVVDPVGVPVVVHKYFEAGPRFDGTFGSTWEDLADNTGAYNYALMTYQPAHIPDIYNTYPAIGQRYSPADDAWTALSTTGPSSIEWFQLAPVGTDLYGFEAYTTEVHRYQTLTDTWTKMADFASGGTNEYTMAVADEKGIVYGYTSNGNVISYDPASGSMGSFSTNIPALHGSGSLYETRLAYDPPTRTLFIGAYPEDDLYSFNLDTLVTDALEPIPEIQLNDIFCGDRSGHIYAAGDSGGQTMWQYDIASDSWDSLPDLPADHGNAGTCLVSDDGHLYVGVAGPGLYRLPLN